MAVLTAQGISQLAIALLVRSLVLPRTIVRAAGLEFAGSNGDTITIRVRQPRVAKEQVNPGDTITLDDIAEVGVDLTVRHLYDGARVSDEELTLEIEDFGSQVLQPIVASVATAAEDQVAGVLNALTPTIFNVADATVEDAVLEAREELGINDVPAGRRWLAVSPEFASLLLKLDNLSDVSAAGSPSALRDAVIGRYRGFNVVESNALTAGEAVAYHESAAVWANRAPGTPAGAGFAMAREEQGVALRVLQDFDGNTLRDRIIVSTFAGCALVTEDEAGLLIDRAVKLTTAVET